MLEGSRLSPRDGHIRLHFLLRANERNRRRASSIARSDGRVFLREENAGEDRREATRGFCRVSLATSQRNGPIVIAVVVVVVVVIVVVVVVCLHRESGRTAGETRASGRGSTTKERERESE